MQIWIIEDEASAARSLERLLTRLRPDWDDLGRTGSIVESIPALEAHPELDLIFADIRLEDGLSFAIFERVRTEALVVFTTAYDEYALKAFDYNCIDYLLKPYREEALTRALEKCERILGRRAASDPASAQEPLSEWPGSQVTAALGGVYADLGAGRPVYRSRILLHKGQDEVVRETKDLCYAELDEGGVRVYFCDGEWADYPGSLGALSESLDPERFQRISRQVILRLDHVDHLTPGPGRDTLVHLKAPYGTVSFTITADSKKRLLDGLRLIW